ncbi:MAG: helix-turn-helix domain-containing protein, partial [Flammeovirgaceae bacterium]
MNLNEIIGKNLAALREKRGLSQEEVAMYLDVKRPVISYYETAEREIPLLHLEKLADLFCVEVADLTAEEPTPEHPQSLAFAFRTVGLSAEDIKICVSFQMFLKIFLKLKR